MTLLTLMNYNVIMPLFMFLGNYVLPKRGDLWYHWYKPYWREQNILSCHEHITTGQIRGVSSGLWTVIISVSMSCARTHTTAANDMYKYPLHVRRHTQHTQDMALWETLLSPHCQRGDRPWYRLCHGLRNHQRDWGVLVIIRCNLSYLSPNKRMQ